MNLDILIQSKRIQLQSPSLKRVIEVSKKLETIDPNHKLSQTDIEVLTLAWEKKGTLVTNDFILQNSAAHLEIPTRVFSGRKINRIKKGYLRCRGCKSIFHSTFETCPSCGSELKHYYTNLRKDNND
jgi:rRNA maturation endonuclease Nob1